MGAQVPGAPEGDERRCAGAGGSCRGSGAGGARGGDVGEGDEKGENKEREGSW